MANYVDSGRIIDVFVENVDEQNLHIVESVIIEAMKSFEKTIIPNAHAWRVYYDINDDDEEPSHSSSDGEEPNSSEEDVEFDPLHDSEYEMDEDHGFEDVPTKHDRKDSDENMTESLEQNVMDGFRMEPWIEDDLIEVDLAILTCCDVTEDPGTLNLKRTGIQGKLK
ncbi:hypothetical protein LIER_29472 [Lithospermum erythrorhizon]|uniref:Uncharacterized protein n=1 Tax=Lithospermum erythrorhizon TaxID=34254 RepID=A0AAV3RMB9_LITER